MTTAMVSERQDLRSQVVELAEEAIDRADLFLVDVVVRGRKGSMVVEVFVDGDDAVGLDDLASISRSLGFVLETGDLIRGKYHLNVSSPGGERSLVVPRQYGKHVGREIEIKLLSSDDGEDSSVFDGELVSRSDTDIQIRLKTGTERAFTYDEIKQARIRLPW